MLSVQILFLSIFLDREPNENGQCTVTIRGADEDVQKAKKIIEDLTVDLLSAAASQPEPQKEYEIIDWKAAAQECVSSTSCHAQLLTRI